MAARNPWLTLCLLLALGTAVPAARAQHGGPPGGGGPPMGGPPPGGPPPMGMPGGDPNARGNFPNGGPPPGNAPDSAGTVSSMRGGLQLGPPGRWWDDHHFAHDLGLRPDQQRRMDAIFEESRPELFRRFQALQAEQNRLEALTHARVLDEPALMAAIDRVGQARIELEKTNTHMLLQIRAQMDPNQIARLESHR